MKSPPAEPRPPNPEEESERPPNPEEESERPLNPEEESERPPNPEEETERPPNPEEETERPPNPEEESERPPNPEEEERRESEAGETPGEESKVQRDSEKDSGYSDSSSESLSSEETNGAARVDVAGSTPETSTAQTTPTPIYILQHVLLNQPRLLLLQPPIRRHRKRPSPSSYLPILRSYQKIAPRLVPLPTPSPAPRSSTPPIHRLATSHLLEVSLRSLALQRRMRESQRCVRELRTHARLYERALRGEAGGWERLQSAMEQSGGYRKMAEPAALRHVTMTSSGDHEEAMTSSEESMTSSETMPSEGKL